MKLHLEDATAELDALLTGEHGSAFFRVGPSSTSRAVHLQ